MPYRLHALSDRKSWPSDVSAIVQELDFSAARSSALSEILYAFNQLIEGCNSGYTDLERENLHGLPDAIIQFSSFLREIQRRRACGEEHCNLTFTYQFIKLVGLCIDEKASITGEMPFVCPRGFSQPQGVTSALVARIVRGSQRKNKEDERRAVVAKEYEDDDDEDDEDDEDRDDDFDFDDMSISKRSSTLPAYSPWLSFLTPKRRPVEPPLRVCSEAHVLLSNTIGAMAVLPVLPVADSENIIPLISSVLYQRRVWGIDLPVVGICLSRYDATVRIYVGWLDPEALTPAGLPLVHIARPDPPATNVSSIGLFDLGDATSAVAFARFVLSLRHQFTRIDECVNNTLVPIRWQLCSLAEDNGPLPYNGDGSGILKWATQVSESCLGNTTPRIPQAGVHDRHSQPAHTTLSEMARRKSKPIDTALLSIESWLTARRVVSLSTLNPGRKSGPYGSEVQRMLPVYDRLTDFRSPMKWVHEPTRATNGEAFDVVPDVFPNETRNLLCQQYNEMARDLRRQKLCEALSDSVEEKLAICLYLSTTSRDRTTVDSRHNDVDEAEARRGWDALHVLGFASTSDAAYPGDKLERSLALPRSNLLDDFLDLQGDHLVQYSCNPPSPREVPLVEQPLGSYLDIARWTRELCAKQFAEAASRLVTLRLQSDTVSPEELSKAKAVHKHADIAADVAVAAVRSLEQLQRSAHTLRTVLHYHTMEEPDHGICDAVLLSFIFGNNQRDKEDISRLSEHLRDTKSNLVALQQASSQSSAELSHADQYDQYSETPDKMDYPVLRTETDNDSVTKHKSEESEELPQGDTLCIPRLVVENKKPSEKNRKISLHQCRAYCVASVQFLAYLGVYRHPVFGAAIDGKICYVLMAWTDEKGTTFLFDREVRTFNITIPIQAWQYLTFLLRLKREADEQKAELTRKILTHFRASQTQSATQQPRSWTKAAQTKEFPKFHRPPPPPPKTPNRPEDDVSTRKGATHTV